MSFIQAICPDSKEFHVSAPNSFSIINDRDRECKVMDIQTSMKNFKKIAPIMKDKLKEGDFSKIEEQVRSYLHSKFGSVPVDSVFIVYPDGPKYEVGLHEEQPHSRLYLEQQEYLESLGVYGRPSNDFEEQNAPIRSVQNM